MLGYGLDTEWNDVPMQNYELFLRNPGFTRQVTIAGINASGVADIPVCSYFCVRRECLTHPNQKHSRQSK